MASNKKLVNMRLETERLIIRPYRKSDLMDCFRLMQDKELFRYKDMDVMTLKEYKELFKWLLKSYHTGFDGDYKYSFNVILKETGKHIGWVGIGGMDSDHSMKEIYWLIGIKYQNQGYATEAAAALLRFGFDVMGINEIFSKCWPENVASWKVMEHIGLKRRDAMESGETLYSLTKDEYIRGKKGAAPMDDDTNNYIRLFGEAI